MILAWVGAALSFVAALLGLTLAAFLFLARRRSPRWLLAVHPMAGMAGLACLWASFALWGGPRDLPFDAGVFALTLTLVAGAFLFSLQVTRLPPPFFVVLLHGAAAVFGCALLIVGLVQVAAVA